MRSFRVFAAAFRTRFCRQSATFFTLLLAVSGHALFAQTATSTTLDITANNAPTTSVALGTVVTMTASVAAGATPVTVGQVDLCDAAATYCSDIKLLGTAQLTSAGTAIFRLTPGAGTHTYKAVFHGTTANAASTSTTQSLSVTASDLPTTTAISSSGNPGNYTLKATVSSFGNLGVAPGGQVQFVDVTGANTVLGSATLTPSTAAFSMVSSTAPSFKTGKVATGDFNNDGHTDIVGFDNSGNLNVALGGGDGTFQELPSLKLLTYASIEEIVVGDLNADGRQDLVVLAYAGDCLTILLGNGDGTFTVGSSPIRGTFPSGIAMSDFNHDGKLDLAVSNVTTSNVSILLGNGDGTFTSAAVLSTASGPANMLTADFDSDGVSDLAVLTLTDYAITIYHGNGDGTFTAASTPAYVGFDITCLATADVNGDGAADILVGAAFFGPISLFGRGDGTFTTGPYISSWFLGAMVVADFNGDGKADVAAPDGNSGGTNGPIIFIGNGDGTFTANGRFAGLSSSSIAAADFNRDGSPDIVFVNGNTASSQPLMLLLGESGLTATATATGVAPIGTNTHQIKAVYAGDANFTGSSSATLGLTGTKVTPTLTLSANPASGTYGQQIMLTATLAPYTEPGLSSDGESVSFYSGTSYLGSATLSSGVAIFNVTSLHAGTNSLTAQYGGDVALASVTSNAVSFPVTQATPTITWTPPASATYTGKGVGSLLNATSTVTGSFTYTATPSGGSPITVNSASILGAGSYTLTAKLTPNDTTDYTTASSTVAYTITPATLTVVPANATRAYGAANPTLSASVTGALNSDTFTVTGSTTATAASPVGTYPITYAVTGANLANYTVTSANGTLTVTKATPTITWSTPASIVYGTALSGTELNASVSIAGTLSYTPAAGTVLEAGPKFLSVAFTPADSANYAPATATTVLVIARAPSTTTLTLSNQNLTMTANVASTTSGVPTGSVSFYADQTLLGTGTLTNGVASYTASAAPSGNTILSARYGGDTNFALSSSKPISILSVTPSATSLTVTQGGSTTDTLTLSVAPGYVGTLQFSCSGLPANTNCSFQPASATFDGTKNSASVVLTVQTNTTHAANAGPSTLPGGGVPLFAITFVPGLFAGCFVWRKRLAANRLLLVLVLSGIALAASGCAGSSSTSTTPTGSSAFQVVATGSNGLVLTTNLNLTVQ